MVEAIFEIIFGFIGELVLEIVVEVLVEFGFHGTAERVSDSFRSRTFVGLALHDEPPSPPASAAQNASRARLSSLFSVARDVPFTETSASIVQPST